MGQEGRRAGPVRGLRRRHSSRDKVHPKIADKRNMEDHSFGLRSYDPSDDRGLFLLIQVYSLPLVGLDRVLDHGSLTASPPMHRCSPSRAKSHELKILQHALEVAEHSGYSVFSKRRNLFAHPDFLTFRWSARSLDPRPHHFPDAIIAQLER